MTKPPPAQDQKTYEILLPPLAKELSPNWRGHWRPKAKTVKRTREIACAMCLEAIGRRPKPRWEEAVEETTFIFATKHRRDADNLAAGLKSVWDGFVDAGLLADDRGLAHLPVIIRYGFDENPGVLIRISRGQCMSRAPGKARMWGQKAYRPRAIRAKDFIEEQDNG